MNDSKEIEYESRHSLLVEEKVPFGFLVYNAVHEKRNVCVISDDINVISEKLWRGWKLYPGETKWVLQAPEITLSDLSEPYKNTIQNLKGIYTYHKVLERIDLEKEIEKVIKGTDKFDGLSAIIISGKYNSVEHRIVASDIRGKKIPYLLYEKVKNEYKDEFKEVLDDLDEDKLNALERELNIYRLEAEKGSIRTQSIYTLMLGYYTRIGASIDTREHGWIIKGVWDQTPKADVYIFVPKSGIKFGLGFIEDRQTIDNVMFWEYHVGMDSMKEVIFMKQNLNGKDALIIDKSYSGKTLTYLKNQVTQLGGTPHAVAMFPKSKEGIKNIEYIITLDKLIRTQEVNLGRDWHEELFWKAVMI